MNTGSADIGAIIIGDEITLGRRADWFSTGRFTSATIASA
jgi:hypothetical protein